MKIATWNINGLRSASGQLVDYLLKEEVDILCLQEIKVDDSRLSEELKNIDGYTSFWFHAKKPGYSGVAVYTKIKPKKVAYGIGEEEFDQEGRAIILTFDKFTLANFYFPHSGRTLGRLNFKLKMNKAFLKFLSKNDQDKMIVCGDLNVAHQDIDLARPKDNRKNAGFTEVERQFMDEILRLGWIDIYRSLNPFKQEYTWWSQRFGARARNIGWRIDYFLCKEVIIKKIKQIEIQKNILGSDHCPVMVELQD